MSDALRKLSRQGEYEPIAWWVKEAIPIGPKLSEIVMDVAKPLLD